MTWTPRLRTVFLIVHLIILAMPIGAIAALRIYESELIRQTEAELIAQGAFIESTYRNALLDELEGSADSLDDLGHPPAAEIEMVDGKFIPVSPGLDVNAERIRPPAEDPRPNDHEARPAATAAGERLGVILREAQRITFAGIRVVDSHGTIIATTGEHRGWSISHHEEVRRALTGEFVSILRQRISDSPRPPLESISRRTKVRVFVAVPILVQHRVVGAVVLSRTPKSFAKALYENRLVFLFMLLSLLVGVALITVLTLVTIRRPIRHLIEQTRRIARDPDDVTPIEQPGTREFQELSAAFSGMAQTLSEREDYITTFARNVSHEFKTPLSSIRGSVELLQDHFDQMEPEERDEFLDVVAKDCDRLDRLVERLLELARADVLRPGLEAADVTDVARAVAADFQTADFRVDVDTTGPLAAPVARETLESLFTNLVSNAQRHGGTHATVRIRPLDDQIEIRVSDDGPGIDDADVDRIFDEFFTTARTSGGTGLGLPIIRTLVEAHGGSIELVDPATATFRVLLHRAEPSSAVGLER